MIYMQKGSFGREPFWVKKQRESFILWPDVFTYVSVTISGGNYLRIA